MLKTLWKLDSCSTFRFKLAMLSCRDQTNVMKNTVFVTIDQL